MIAALLTVSAACLITLLGLALFMLYKTIQEGRGRDDKLDQIHMLVNSKMTIALDRTQALEELLRRSGIEVPPTDKEAPG